MSDLFKNDETFLARWLSGELSSEELAEFKKSEEYAQYQKIAGATTNLDTPSWQKDKIWEAIDATDKNESDQTKKEASVIQLGWLKYIAAAWLIILVGYFSMFQKGHLETIETVAAEMEQVKLPDGSMIYLNAASSITYNVDSYRNNRAIELTFNT